MKLVADLHVHTVASGHAYSTIEEYVAQAKKIGLKGLAIADHGPAMPGAPHAYHFQNMGMIPPKINGIRVYRGIEANVTGKEGETDLPPEWLTPFEIVLIAMHPLCGYEDRGEVGNTETLFKAISKNPRINLIAHAGNPKYPLKVEETVALAREKKVVLEINNSSFTSRAGSWDRCLQFAREIKRQNAKVVLTTDSHISMMLGVFDKSLKLMKEAGISDDQVLNTSLNRVQRYLIDREELC